MFLERNYYFLLRMLIREKFLFRCFSVLWGEGARLIKKWGFDQSGIFTGWRGVLELHSSCLMYSLWRGASKSVLTRLIFLHFAFFSTVVKLVVLVLFCILLLTFLFILRDVRWDLMGRDVLMSCIISVMINLELSFQTIDPSGPHNQSIIQFINYVCTSIVLLFYERLVCCEFVNYWRIEICCIVPNQRQHQQPKQRLSDKWPSQHLFPNNKLAIIYIIDQRQIQLKEITKQSLHLVLLQKVIDCRVGIQWCNAQSQLNYQELLFSTVYRIPSINLLCQFKCLSWASSYHYFVLVSIMQNRLKNSLASWIQTDVRAQNALFWRLIYGVFLIAGCDEHDLCRHTFTQETEVWFTNCRIFLLNRLFVDSHDSIINFQESQVEEYWVQGGMVSRVQQMMINFSEYLAKLTEPSD